MICHSLNPRLTTAHLAAKSLWVELALLCLSVAHVIVLDAAAWEAFEETRDVLERCRATAMP